MPSLPTSMARPPLAKKEFCRAKLVLAAVPVPQRRRAVPVHADVIAEDNVSCRAAVTQRDAVLVVPADEVAGPGRGAADCVIVRTESHVDAVAGVPQIDQTGDVGAEVI